MLNNEEIIIFAANRGTWLRERFTPSGISRMFGEKLIPKFKEKMEILRSVDDRILEWTKDLDQIIDNMRTALKTNRFIDLAMLLNNLNRKLKIVDSLSGRIKQLEEAAIQEFELSDQAKIPIKQRSAIPKVKKSEIENELITEAGWLENTKREWVARKFENKFRKERKIALNKLIDKANFTVQRVYQLIKELHKARAYGEIGKYLETLKNISMEQKSFQNQFFPIYQKYLEDLVNKAIETQKFQETEEAPKTAPGPDPHPPVVPESKIISTVPQSPVFISTEPASSEPKTPPPISGIIPSKKTLPTGEAPAENDEDDAPTQASPKALPKPVSEIPLSKEEEQAIDDLWTPSPRAIDAVLKLNHNKFIKAFRSVNNLSIKADLLFAYAEKIKDISPENSLKLINIGESLLNE